MYAIYLALTQQAQPLSFLQAVAQFFTKTALLQLYPQILGALDDEFSALLLTINQQS